MAQHGACPVRVAVVGWVLWLTANGSGVEQHLRGSTQQQQWLQECHLHATKAYST
jgi:hypothetical protein